MLSTRQRLTVTYQSLLRLAVVLCLLYNIQLRVFNDKLARGDKQQLQQQQQQQQQHDAKTNISAQTRRAVT